MKALRNDVSWRFLDDYRGKFFNSNWPTLPQMFRISVERWPDNECFVDFEGSGGAKRSLSYAEAWNKIEALAQWMAANGIKKGDRVAVSGKNSPEWATAFFASMLAGAIVCPMDYALRESELANLLKAAKPKLFFVDEEKYEWADKNRYGAKIYSLSPKYQKTFVFNLGAPKKAPALPELSDKDTAAILFTSGTTGTPKGVMLSHENLVSDCFIAQQNIILYDSDVFYNLLPIHHAYTMQAALICPLSAGCSIVFGKSMAVTRLLKELKEGKITLMLGVPLLYNKLYSGIMKGVAAKGKLAKIFVGLLMNISYGIKKFLGANVGKYLLHSVLEAANISTIRVAICGGGPLAPSVFRAYNALGIDFIQGYGLTETSPIIALNPKERFKIESVGMDFSPWEEIKILNPDEQGVGEIAVKGPMVMQGYYNMPYETQEMFTKDGFLKTGDLGWLDSEHYLMLSGRAKNLIVTEGGKNVYPEEIEDAFQLYYDVEQIMVRGYVADQETKSEQIEALVYPADDLLKRLDVPRADAAASQKVYGEVKAIVDKVNKTLQPYARVSKITLLDEPLEMTTTRKIKRSSVQAAQSKKAPASEKAAAKNSRKPKSAAAASGAKKAATEKTKVAEKPKSAATKSAGKPKTAAIKTNTKTKVAGKPKTAAVKTQTKKGAAKAASAKAEQKAAPKKKPAASPAKKSAAASKPKSASAKSDGKAKKGAKKTK